MQDFKKKPSAARHILRFLAVGVGVLLMLLVAAVALRAAWTMYGTFRTAAEARERTEQELAALRTDEARAAAALSSLESPYGIEKEVRERYGVAKPGEGEIHIVRDEAAFGVGTTEPDSFFKKLFKSLFAW